MSNALTFVMAKPGRFHAYRGTTHVGGIEFKPGGWIAYEMRNGRPRWTPSGRIKASGAASDLWGEAAGKEVARFPENRPAPQQDEGERATYRRQLERSPMAEIRP